MTKKITLSGFAAAAIATLLLAPVHDAEAKTVRDHRAQPTVRDHRAQPTVRDHRAQPTVRDHRTQPTVRVHGAPPGVRIPKVRW